MLGLASDDPPWLSRTYVDMWRAGETGRSDESRKPGRGDEMDPGRDQITNARPLVETRLCYGGALGCHLDAMRSGRA